MRYLSTRAAGSAPTTYAFEDVLLLFGQVSLAGPIANAVAIPAVSAVLTPLALVAALVPLDFLLHLAAWLGEWLLQFLEWCAALPGALWQQHVPPLWSVALALFGTAWLLAPRGVPWRGAGLAYMAPAFCLLPRPEAPKTPKRHRELAKALVTSPPEEAAVFMREHVRFSEREALERLKPYFRMRKAHGRTFFRSERAQARHMKRGSHAEA